jgi:hypothetical protein
MGSERSSAMTSLPSADVTNPLGAKVVPSTSYSLGPFTSTIRNWIQGAQSPSMTKNMGNTDSGYAHLVRRQSACFVRANNICAPQCLYARKISDDGVFLSHLLGT